MKLLLSKKVKIITSICVIIFIFSILLNYKFSEHFTEINIDLKNEFIRNLKNSIEGNIIYEDNIKITRLNNSSKIFVENLTKVNNINNEIFIRNLTYKSNISLFNNINGNNVNNNQRNNILIYNKNSLEHTTNVFSGYYISEGIKTFTTNKNYGFRFQYNPIKNNNNYAEISLDFSKERQEQLNRIKNINENLNNPLYLNIPRKTVNIYTSLTAPYHILPYFKKGEDNKEIKLLILFYDQVNQDFVKLFDKGKFNVLDTNMNYILTECEIDNPYCQINLQKRDKILGRDKYIVGKFNPNKNSFSAVNSNKFIQNKINNNTQDLNNINKFKEYDLLNNCIKKENKDINNNLYNNNHISDFNYNIKPIKNTKPDLYIEKHNNTLKKLKDINKFKCREHYLDDDETDKRHYYGGLDYDNNMKCYGSKNNCFLFKNKAKCLEKERKIKEIEIDESSIDVPAPSLQDIVDEMTENLEQEKLINEQKYISDKLKNKDMLRNYNSIDESEPGFIGEKYIDNFNDFKTLNCIKNYKKEAFCKHINENRIADILTFKDLGNFEKKINETKILELNPEFFEPKRDGSQVTDEEIEKEETIKYLIEPYSKKFKDTNPGLIFDYFKYKIRIIEEKTIDFNTGTYKFETNIHIYENNNFLTKMTDNDNNTFILNKNNFIHVYIDNNYKFNVNILDSNSLILSKFKGNKKIKGNFGDEINLYLRTNNNTIFDNIGKVEKISKLVYPYNPFIDIDEF